MHVEEHRYHVLGMIEQLQDCSKHAVCDSREAGAEGSLRREPFPRGHRRLHGAMTNGQ